MSVLQKIQSLLDTHNAEYRVLTHEPVITCEDAAKIRHTSPDQGAKALVCYADKQPILIVLPCSHKLDFKAFKKEFQIKDLRMATPAEVLELTSLEIGSIPPIHLVINISRTFLAEPLTQEPQLCFNAGRHDTSIILNTKDYLRIVNPTVGNYTIRKDA